LGLSEAEANAVVALVWKEPGSPVLRTVCSGVVIGSSQLLTAAHCLEAGGSGQLEVVVGPRLGCRLASLTAHVTTVHPELDLALVTTDVEFDPGMVEPLAVAIHSSDEMMPGSMTEVAGFGSSGRAPPEGRRFLVATIAQVTATALLTDGAGRIGACGGDSGGPMLVRGQDGAPLAIGLLSVGSEDYRGSDEFLRLDRAADWLEPLVQGRVPRKPCGAITSAGRCFGRSVVRFVDGSVTADQCAGSQHCYWTPSRHYGCTSEGGGACGTLDQLGTCDAGVAKLCDEGNPRDRGLRQRAPLCSVAPFRSGRVPGRVVTEGRSRATGSDAAMQR